MKNCFIYCRQSSGCGDAENSLSIRQQLTNCLEKALKLELEVAGVFTDANISGKTYPAGKYFEETAAADKGFQTWFSQQSGSKKFRTGLGNLLERLEEVDFIIVDEITRLHRAAANSFLEQVLTFEITQADVKIIQVKGGTIDLKSFDQNLIHILKTRINDEQIANQKRKSIESRRKLKDSGIFCNVKFYGAVYDGNKKFHFDPEQAEVIRFAFDNFTAEKPFTQIIREINQKYSARLNGARCFYGSTLRHILTQPLYAGLMYNSTGQLIKCTNAPEALIPEEQFFKAGAIIANRRYHASKPRSSEKRDLLIFSGFLRCRNCGANLVAVYDRRRLLYKCRNDADAKCRRSRIFVSGGVSEQNGLKHALTPLLVIAAVRQQQLLELADSGGCRLKMLQQRETELRNKVRVAFELFEEDVLEAGDYKQSVRNCMAQIKKLRQEQLYLTASAPSREEIFQNFCRWNTIVEGIVRQIYSVSNAEYRKMLSQSVDHISVAENEIFVATVSGNFTIPRLPRDKRQLRVMPHAILKQNFDKKKPLYEVYFFCNHKRKKELLLEWKNIKIFIAPSE